MKNKYLILISVMGVLFLLGIVLYSYSSNQLIIKYEDIPANIIYRNISP